MRMRPMVLVALATVAFTVGAPGNASTTYSGTILAPNPASYAGAGATEIAAGCEPSSALNGTDGVWYEIPQGPSGDPIVLIPGEAATDVDAWFYTQGCTLIVDDSMARTSIGEQESSTIPTNAGYVVVNLFIGAPNSTFTLTIG